jgi:formamidopyrimidine-DNA glycosylase
VEQGSGQVKEGARGPGIESREGVAGAPAFEEAPMPELPDLLYILDKLRERLLGRVVSAERVRQPVVLRFAVRGNLSLLLGRPLQEIFRKSHFLVFRFDGLDLAVNPMLAGRFRTVAPGERDEGWLAFALAFGEEVELRYLDDKAMGKAYLIATDDWKAVPGMQTGGIDILAPEFTPERFVSLLKHRRDQVRVFLLDKKALDSLGNAYADEVLFEAGIHPKTFCRSLSHDDALRLHQAIVRVMRDAVAEVATRAEPIEVKVRDFLKVRRKETCPRCGGKLRTAGVKGMDAYFCPRCQPPTRSGLVDWTRTGK